MARGEDINSIEGYENKKGGLEQTLHWRDNPPLKYIVKKGCSLGLPSHVPIDFRIALLRK